MLLLKYIHLSNELHRVASVHCEHLFTHIKNSEVGSLHSSIDKNIEGGWSKIEVKNNLS